MMVLMTFSSRKFLETSRRQAISSYHSIFVFPWDTGIRRIRRADGEAALVASVASAASASVLNGSFPQLSRIGLAFDMWLQLLARLLFGPSTESSLLANDQVQQQQGSDKLFALQVSTMYIC